jgi:O-antigen/teichoic acid export membrane protein
MNVFTILLVNLFMIFVNVSLAHLLVAWNHHKKYLIVVSSGAIANIACNIMLIPTYGIIGAAIATVCAEVVVLGTTLYYHNRLHGLFASRKEMT